MSIFKKILAGLVILAFISVIMPNTTEENKSDKPQPIINQEKTKEETKEEVKAPSESQAYIISQSFVKDYLKAPSTAKFGLGDYKCNVRDNNEYAIFSNVDAQNSFGGMLNSSYTARIKYLGNSWAEKRNWQLQFLMIEGEVYYLLEEE